MKKQHNPMDWRLSALSTRSLAVFNNWNFQTYNPNSRESALRMIAYYAGPLGSALPADLGSMADQDLISLRDRLKAQSEASYHLQSYTGGVTIVCLPTQEEALERLRNYAETGEAVHCYRPSGTDYSVRIVPEPSGYRLSIYTETDDTRTYHHTGSTNRKHRTALEALEALVSWSWSVSYPLPAVRVTIEPNVPRIVSTYETITPESAECGDFASTGFENEDGELIVPDETDTKEDGDGNEVPMSVVDLAVKYLQDHYVSEPSSSSWSGPGVWYSTEHTTEDYSTAETKSLSYHLKGFTEDQERGIFAALFPTRRTN